MTTVYVMATCPDCVEVKAKLKDNTEYRIIDIGENVGDLKEFLRMRDHSPAFDAVKSSGSIGIPCFVKEKGEISFDAAEFLIEKYAPGAACSIDGKGC